MSTLIHEERYLRVLTPRTNRGQSPKTDEHGRPTYKESYARYSKQVLRAFESINKRRPHYQKIILEVVENRDFIPKRKHQLAQRNGNPRPKNEKRISEPVDLEALKAQIRAELEAEKKAVNKPAPAKVMKEDKEKQLNALIEEHLNTTQNESKPV